jgi:hypothetical protein
MAKSLKTADGLKNLIEIIKEFNNLTDDLAKEKVGAKLTVIQKACNDFMNRTRINNEALIPLLEIYKTDSSLLQPIGLVIRSMLSDFLTSCYLMTFHDPKDSTEESLTNELYVFDRDFLRSMLETMELEKIIHELNPAFKPIFKDDDEYKAKVSTIKKIYPHVYKKSDPELRLKKIEEIRDTSDKKYFSSKEEFATVGGGFMSEKYKFERIKSRGFAKYSTAFISFKYFSQFQHYSKKAMDMLEDDFQNFGYFHLVASYNLALIATHFQIQLIDGTTSKYIKRLDTLLPKLDNCFV